MLRQQIEWHTTRSVVCESQGYSGVKHIYHSSIHRLSIDLEHWPSMLNTLQKRCCFGHVDLDTS